MEGIIFIRRVFGNWLVISLGIIYELCILNDLLTNGKSESLTGAIHMAGVIILALLFSFTKDDNKVANKHGYYLFAVLLITSWFAYK